MERVNPKLVIYGGLGLAALTSVWWYRELVGFLGKSVNYLSSLSCLIEFGGGSCRYLWFIGLHQENLRAAFLFYIGVGIWGFGVWLYNRNT